MLKQREHAVESRVHVVSTLQQPSSINTSLPCKELTLMGDKVDAMLKQREYAVESRVHVGLTLNQKKLTERPPV